MPCMDGVCYILQAQNLEGFIEKKKVEFVVLFSSRSTTMIIFYFIYFHSYHWWILKPAEVK